MFFQSRVRRINVFVQSTSNPDNLTARTFPPINTFTIPNSSAITQRFNGVIEGYFSVSLPYQDILTTSANNVTLVALRTIIPLDSQNIMFEIEMPKESFASILRQQYYFPSAIAILASYDGSTMNYLSDVPPEIYQQNMSTYYELGHHRVTV
jgi:hypothetical protein